MVTPLTPLVACSPLQKLRPAWQTQPLLKRPETIPSPCGDEGG